MTERLRFLRSRVMVASQHYALRRPINTVNMFGQRVDQSQTRLVTAFESMLVEQRNRLNRSRELLVMFRPEAILQRGYAMVKDSGGAIVRDLLRRKPGEMVTITCARGSADAEVKRVFEEPAL
jgi:exodeoxyribonuclease VII large subunit